MVALFPAGKSASASFKWLDAWKTLPRHPRQRGRFPFLGPWSALERIFRIFRHPR